MLSKSLKIKLANYIFTSYEIKHSLLRASITPPNDPEFQKEFLMNISDNPKARFKCPKAESLINFGFYYPYQSNPFLKIFTEENLLNELAELAQLCLISSKLDMSSHTLILPGFISLHKEDFFSEAYNKNFMQILKTCLFDNINKKNDQLLAKWYLFL